MSCRSAQTSSFISRGSLCLSWQYALGKLADRRTERGEITYHLRRRKRWKENKKETTELRACIWRSRGPWQEQCGKEEGTDTQRGRQPRDQKEIERRITDLGRWMKLSGGYAHVCLYVHRQIQEILHALERIKKSLKGERRERVEKNQRKGSWVCPVRAKSQQPRATAWRRPGRAAMSAAAPAAAVAVASHPSEDNHSM